ncbi:unnamed protein product, partial [Ectocarpus sp. 6 AP-2014]
MKQAAKRKSFFFMYSIGRLYIIVVFSSSVIWLASPVFTYVRPLAHRCGGGDCSVNIVGSFVFGLVGWVTNQPRVVMASRAGGGQESLALMNNYLAKVKDECKPAIYSAFIRLMNAYHGNTLHVDAFLDELYVLFSPRVYLLADVKPLVDESYHQRIDELCDKVRTGGSSGGGGGGGDGLSFPPTLNALASSPGSSNGNNINNRTAAAVPGIGGGSGINAEPRSTNPIRDGSGAGSEAEASAAGGGSSEARSGTSSLLSPPTMADATSGGGGGVGSSGKASAPARSNDELEGMLSLRRGLESSPSTRVLSSDLPDTTDMAGLLSGIEPGVDAALLDFMMCDNDNTPVLGAAAPPAEPPTLNIQQQQPQQQQQQQPWVFSSPLPPTMEPVTPSGNGATSGTSPTKKRRASEDCSSSVPAAAGRVSAGSTDAAANSDNSSSGDGRTASPSMMWSRAGSAPNLTNLSCRMQATLPSAHSRGQQQQQLQPASSSATATTSAPRPRCSVAISNGGTSKKQSMTGRPPSGASVNRGGGGNLQMQQAVGGGGGVPGGSPSNSTGGSEKNSGGSSSSSSSSS